MSKTMQFIFGGPEGVENIKIHNINPLKMFVFSVDHGVIVLQAYKNEVYLLLKELAGKVAYLHLPMPGVQLTDLAQKRTHYSK